MIPKNLTLRCYAARELDGSWYAVCLDLNLLAQADDLDAAQKKLHSMIKNYASEAFTKDKHYINSLIPRRAPFVFFLYYYFARIASIVHHFKNISIFNDSLTLTPA